MDGVVTQYDGLVIAGYFNLDQLKANPQVSDFNDMLHSYGCCVLNTNPTHYAPNSKQKDIVKTFDQFDVPGVSHHDMIYCHFIMGQKLKRRIVIKSAEFDSAIILMQNYLHKRVQFVSQLNDISAICHRRCKGIV